MQEKKRAKLLKPVWFKGLPYLAGDKVEWPKPDIDFLISVGSAESIEGGEIENSEDVKNIFKRKKRYKGE
jgi:hypothetical protein